MQEEQCVLSTAAFNVLFSVEKDMQSAARLLRSSAADAPDDAAKALITKLADELETVRAHIFQARDGV